MNHTALLNPTNGTCQTVDSAMLAGIGLSGFPALLLELALTRLLSVVLFYHFAFIAISIALLDSVPGAYSRTSEKIGWPASKRARWYRGFAH